MYSIIDIIIFKQLIVYLLVSYKNIFRVFLYLIASFRIMYANCVGISESLICSLCKEKDLFVLLLIRFLYKL